MQCSGWERRDMWVLLVGRCRKRPLRERALEIVGGELADYQHFALFLFQMGPEMQICKTKIDMWKKIHFKEGNCPSAGSKFVKMASSSSTILVKKEDIL